MTFATSRQNSLSKNTLNHDPFISEMGEPWSEETGVIAQRAFLAFSDVLEEQRLILLKAIQDAPEPPETHHERDELEDYPKEFQKWIEEHIFHRGMITRLTRDWADLFKEWLAGTIFTVGGINYATIPVEIAPSVEGVIGKFDFIDDALMRWIDWRAQNSAIQIAGTSAKRVRKVIHDTVADGPYSIDKVQERLQEDYAFSDARARNIARTEILTAQVTGQFASDLKFYDEGLLSGKVWQDSNDDRVRPHHKHAHGQVREFVEPFQVGDDLMMYPRDTEMGAAASNTIQCRCTYRKLWKDVDEMPDKMAGKSHVNWNDDTDKKYTIPKTLKQTTTNAAESVIKGNRYLARKFADKDLQLHFDEKPFYHHLDAIGATDPKTNEITLNPRFYADKDGVSRYVNENREFFVAVPDKAVSKYPVVHEMGHVLHNELWKDYLSENPKTSLKRSDFIEQELQKIYTNYENITGKKAFRNLPSGYANQLITESFAEIFTLSQLGDINSPWSAAMKEYLRGLK